MLDGTLFQAVRGRLSEIAAERDRKLAKLAEVGEPLADDDNAVELLDALGEADAERLRSVSDDLLRHLFDAFRLTVTYDGRTGRALCRAVVSDDTLPAIQAVLDAIANPGPMSALTGAQQPNVRMCAAPSDRHASERKWSIGCLAGTSS